LLAAGAALVDGTGSATPDGGNLLAVQATRATHSFESVITLCRIGRGVQAAMVNRSLLEDVLDVHWVAANLDEAARLANQHERFFQLGERATLDRYGRVTTSLDDAERKQLAAWLKLYDGFRRSWTLTNENARIALIKGRWREPEAADYIDQTYQVIQRQNNALHHSSPTGLSLALTPGRRGLNREGPDQWWRQALAHGSLGYYLILRVIAAEFNLPGKAAEEAFWRASCVTQELGGEQTRDLGDSDPCPCKSGRAFGACHGS
jgi:hypothetical protein